MEHKIWYNTTSFRITLLQKFRRAHTIIQEHINRLSCSSFNYYSNNSPSKLRAVERQARLNTALMPWNNYIIISTANSWGILYSYHRQRQDCTCPLHTCFAFMGCIEGSLSSDIHYWTKVYKHISKFTQLFLVVSDRGAHGF